MAEPMSWQATCEQVLQQISAVASYGVTEQELTLALRMTLDRVDSSTRSQPWAFMSTHSGYEVHATSREVVDALIGAAPCGHLMSTAEEFGRALRRAGEAITVAELNAAAASLLGHLRAGGRQHGTVVVSCPAFMLEEATRQRVPFQPPSAEEVRRALCGVEELTEAEVTEGLVEVPASLLAPLEPVAPVERAELPDGVVSLRLPNGLRVRLLVRPSSPDGPVEGTMRLTMPGGRAGELRRGLPAGSTEASLRTLESCGVGEWKREQLQLYQKLRSTSVELRAGADVSEAFVHFASSADSCRAGLEYLHWLLRQPRMDMQGFMEGQLRMKGNANAREKSLENRATQALLEGMYPNDPWIAEPTLRQVNMLSMGQVRRAAEAQLGDVGQLQLDIVCSASPRGPSTGSGLSRPTEERGGRSAGGRGRGRDEAAARARGVPHRGPAAASRGGLHAAAGAGAVVGSARRRAADARARQQGAAVWCSSPGAPRATGGRATLSGARRRSRRASPGAAACTRCSRPRPWR
ncbi:unnamed protein product [Prorocentrum cordatum]|uniref:Uncharacterized protein n=1 Tax=Prorocentrum cordatum TaxID=2364126 RepID=A0ABN9TYV4_9DINO|nr:unnamed protein product [Polarella glacialis]